MSAFGFDADAAGAEPPAGGGGGGAGALPAGGGGGGAGAPEALGAAGFDESLDARYDDMSCPCQVVCVQLWAVYEEYDKRKRTYLLVPNQPCSLVSFHVFLELIKKVDVAASPGDLLGVAGR